jgi:hypothetical protein
MIESTPTMALKVYVPIFVRARSFNTQVGAVGVVTSQSLIALGPALVKNGSPVVGSAVRIADKFKPLIGVAVTVIPVLLSPIVSGPLAVRVNDFFGAITKVVETEANVSDVEVSLTVNSKDPALALVPNVTTVLRLPSSSLVHAVKANKILPTVVLPATLVSSIAILVKSAWFRGSTVTTIWLSVKAPPPNVIVPVCFTTKDFTVVTSAIFISTVALIVFSTLEKSIAVAL